MVGDCDPEVGAWICFNPVDGTGRKDANITAYRYALVECDNMDLGRQQAIIKQLELPCAALVYSGGKSVHAIVKVDAPDYTEYRKRVDYLYAACQKNGLTLDQQNRNPSRLSRMPGILRGSQRQTLLETNIGKSCWDEWRDWLEAETDELPETESLADDWDDLPPLADALITGVLRKGHKMLLAGPSKAGKSFALIELCIAIAEGTPWLGRFSCAQGKCCTSTSSWNGPPACTASRMCILPSACPRRTCGTLTSGTCAVLPSPWTSWPQAHPPGG